MQISVTNNVFIKQSQYLILGLFFVVGLGHGRVRAIEPALLTFYPEKTQLNKGQERIVKININSHENLISGIELVMNFDADSVEISKVVRGSFFDKTLVQPEQNKNKLKVVFANSPTRGGKKGLGEVASLYIRNKADYGSVIEIDKSTIIASIATEKPLPMQTNKLSLGGIDTEGKQTEQIKTENNTALDFQNPYEYVSDNDVVKRESMYVQKGSNSQNSNENTLNFWQRIINFFRKLFKIDP